VGGRGQGDRYTGGRKRRKENIIGEWRMKGPLELHKTCMAKMTMTSTK